MCRYCDRAKGWEQPELPAVSGNAITGNAKVCIFDYQTTPPELRVSDTGLAKKLWNGGTAAIHIQIKYCPMCGRKLGA